MLGTGWAQIVALAIAVLATPARMRGITVHPPSLIGWRRQGYRTRSGDPAGQDCGESFWRGSGSYFTTAR